MEINFYPLAVCGQLITETMFFYKNIFSFLKEKTNFPQERTNRQVIPFNMLKNVAHLHDFFQ